MQHVNKTAFELHKENVQFLLVLVFVQFLLVFGLKLLLLSMCECAVEGTVFWAIDSSELLMLRFGF